VVIGGAALNLLGVVSRPTKDCDILFPEIPEEIAKAGKLSRGDLGGEWLNQWTFFLANTGLSSNYNATVRTLASRAAQSA